MALLSAVLLWAGCSDDGGPPGELSCPDGPYASVSLGGGDGRGWPMASDALPHIASHTGVPVADWEPDQFGKDRATWVLHEDGQVVAIAEVVHGDLGWRAGTVQSCGALPGSGAPPSP